MAATVPALSSRERKLLAAFQRDLPLTPRPYAAMGRALGLGEADVIAALERLSARGIVSRVGATIAPGLVGWSTLAAMTVPAARLEAVAELVSGYAEVNHCYEREHELNLWFVVTAASEREGQAVIEGIRRRTALDVVVLPLVEAFHVDLGFPIAWT